MLDVLGFIIVCIDDRGKESYYSVDRDSGNHQYWSKSIFGMEIFKSEEDATIFIMNSKLTTHTMMSSNGASYPNELIHKAIGLNVNKMKGSCKLVVRPLILGNVCMEKPFNEEILDPKGYAY